MRATVLLTLGFAGLLSSPAPAQDWAKAMFKHTAHDFGVVARGAAVEHRFPFENIYLEDAHVTKVESSCGCTKPSLTKPFLKTYEQSEVVATLDTRSFTGRREATIKVVLDQPFPAEVQLHVYAYIRADVVVQPGEAKFESVAQGTPAIQALTVSYAGRPDWKIMQVKTTSPFLEASVVERGRGQGLVTYELRVQLKPNAPAGYLRDQIVLVTNDTVRSATQVPVAVEAMVVPAAQVRPSTLSLGVVRPGQSVPKNLVIQGRTPFRILKATGPDSRFTFQVPKEPKTVQLLPVTFLANETAGRIAGKIRIETDIPGMPVLEVSVDGQIVPNVPIESLPPLKSSAPPPPASQPPPASRTPPASQPPPAGQPQPPASPPPQRLEIET